MSQGTQTEQRDAVRVARGVPLPPDHPQRVELNDEVHARPPVPLRRPAGLTSLALVSGTDVRERQWRHVVELAESRGVAPPEPHANHYVASFGDFRLKFERHTEFTRFVFVADELAPDPFAAPAVSRLPPEWVRGMPGELLVAAHAVLLPWDGVEPDYESLAGCYFGGNVMIGSRIGGGAAMGFTDFRIHGDGFSRILVLDRSLTPNQAGRMVQRLFEIDAYRMLALLALPVARGLSPAIGRSERELAEITTRLATADETMEAGLLDRLTRLEAETESREAENHYRFSAANAYYELVQRRIAELREDRIPGLQTFEEFMERRLAPAMATCRSIAERQESLSQRVSQATQLLSTRVGITRERQNQSLLESMNRRAALQLRLQSTVEGLSAAAVTYYVVGLVNYFAKGLHDFGLPVDAGLVTAASVPVVLLLVMLGLRRIRRLVARREGRE